MQTLRLRGHHPVIKNKLWCYLHPVHWWLLVMAFALHYIMRSTLLLFLCPLPYTLCLPIYSLITSSVRAARCLRKLVATNASHRKASSSFPTTSAMPSSTSLLQCPTRLFRLRRSLFLLPRWWLRLRRCLQRKPPETRALWRTTIRQPSSRVAHFLFILSHFCLFKLLSCLLASWMWIQNSAFPSSCQEKEKENRFSSFNYLTTRACNPNRIAHSNFNFWDNWPWSSYFGVYWFLWR